MKVGHKEECCRSTWRSNRAPKNFKPFKRQARAITAAFKVDGVNRRKYVTVEVNDVPIRLQLDTAADITLISRRTWRKLGQPQVLPTAHAAKNASGGPLHLAGELKCRIAFADRQTTGVCYLTEHPGLDLLGLDWMDQLNLLDKPVNSICSQVGAPKVQCNQFPVKVSSNEILDVKHRHFEVFSEGLGCCTKMQAILNLSPDVKPIFRPKRPVPYAALPVVEAELGRLESEGIIQPVNYSAWAAPIVVVKKPNGKVRICADFSTGLNNALENHEYPLPVPEDLFAKLNGGRCFAKLDLSDAYLQIPVSEDSRELLTINTHKGLFQYTRLPFGVKTAPAIFQQMMDTMLTGISGAAAYLDDIIIMGTDAKDLIKKLDAVLARIADYGLRLRADKCDFFMERVKYLGFIIDKNGRQPDPENIAAIQNMPAPTDVSTLRSFLGLVSHYGIFLPRLHHLKAPLNNLLMKTSKWEWTNECRFVFNKVKSMISSDLLLTHFNPALPIVLAADASNYGVGAVISHVFPDGSEKAIAHASRSLSPAEKNYSQIEKEALAIIFAVKKFHKMLYGKRFKLLTDHKPLLAIFGSKKGIPVYTANRLQRWATTLLAYDFELQYISTLKFGQADALSRLINMKPAAADDAVIAAVAVESEVSQVLADDVRALPVTLQQIQEATKGDNQLQTIIRYTQTSWPKSAENEDMK